MSNNIDWDETISDSTKERLVELASKVYSKEPTQLTKEEIRNVIQMDMATFPSKMTVSAAATRTTEVKFNTNNYHTSIEIDLTLTNDVIKTNLVGIDESSSTIEAYLSMKSALFNLMRIKHEGTESYIRELLEAACSKDNCPKIGRFDR